MNQKGTKLQHRAGQQQPGKSAGSVVAEPSVFRGLAVLESSKASAWQLLLAHSSLPEI